MMNLLLDIIIFILGVISGLILFAWLEKELISKLLLLKQDIIHSIRLELKQKKRR